MATVRACLNLVTVLFSDHGLNRIHSFIHTYVKKLPVASGSVLPAAINSSCHVTVAASSAVGRSLSLVRWSGTQKPDHLRDPTLGSDCFKSRLKSHLFSLY